MAGTGVTLQSGLHLVEVLLAKIQRISLASIAE
jgi:hypothetical protein